MYRRWIEEDERLKIVIVNPDTLRFKCKPENCKQECFKACCVNRSGKRCVEVEKTSKICLINERLCIGCGMCLKKCPFDAIQICNIQKCIHNKVLHRFGPNAFLLCGLPLPTLGEVIGIAGSNGIGKTSMFKILSCAIRPNLGDYLNPPKWNEILKKFKGRNTLKIIRYFRININYCCYD